MARASAAVKTGVKKLKRSTMTLLAILMVAVVLFLGYRFWIYTGLDTTGPVITVDEGILQVSVHDPQEALLAGIRAMDDHDGDVTDSVLIESIYGITDDHITTVVYAAFDQAGNVSKMERKVCYTDYSSPRFTLRDSLTFRAGSGFDVLDYIGAEDVREGRIDRRVHGVMISESNSIHEIGQHTVRFQVMNDLGDCSEIEVTVEVYDPEWYTAKVELSEYLIYLEVGDRFTARDYLKSFNVRGESIDISRSVPDELDCVISGQVNTSVPGVYEVTYQLSQNVNLNHYSGIARLIVIVEE